MNRRILRLAIPNIISNLTVPLLGMADLAILGHLESEVYIGAIAMGGLIFNFIYALFSFLRMGTSGFTAQAYGEDNRQEQMMMMARAMLFAIGGGLVMILLQTPISLLSFYLLDGSNQVEALAEEYYRIRIFAAPASLGILALSGWFTGMQNARSPMIIALVINIINIAANIGFVYGLGMKSDGVAWGTLIAQYSGLILGIWIWFRKYRGLASFYRKEGLLDWNRLKLFFKVNSDIIIRTLCLIFTFAYFTSESAKMGDTILAVNTVLLQYLFVFSYLTDGFAYAAEALVGRYTGAKDKASLKEAVKKLFIWGAGISLPFTMIYLFSGSFLLRLITNQAPVIEAASLYLLWIGLVPVVSFAAFIWDGVFIGATASAPMRNTLLISTLLIFLPGWFLLQGTLGNHGLWIAMLLFMFSRGFLLSLYAPKHIFSLSTARQK